MKKCVINFAKGGWYERGQQRLLSSLGGVGFDGDMLFFNEEHQIGSPTHQESPYAFKPFALKYAVDHGYELVLWADASVWAIRNIQPMFDRIQEYGWMFFLNCLTGNWTSDKCLAGFGIDRDRSMDIPMLMGICMGWNMTHPLCQTFLDQWLAKATDGFSFPGSWTNHNQEVSGDSRVFGHRHDQSVASILAWQQHMNLIIPHETYFEYFPQDRPPHPHTLMVAQGM